MDFVKVKNKLVLYLRAIMVDTAWYIWFFLSILEGRNILDRKRGNKTQEKPRISYTAHNTKIHIEIEQKRRV